MAVVNVFGGWMAAPNYDQGSCYVYEGWRFGSVWRKTRRWKKAGSRRRWGNREKRSRREERKAEQMCGQEVVGFWCLIEESFSL
jgi:hypothetical protein